GSQTFEKVFADFMTRYVEPQRLRSTKDLRRNINNHVMPLWSGREFTSIQRGDVAALIDSVVDNSGPVQADKVLALVSKICRWYATRHHDYISPIVPGMRRSNPKDRARTRILNDDEIRVVWNAAETSGAFGGLVRMALLTGQRVGKLARMKW